MGTFELSSTALMLVTVILVVVVKVVTTQKINMMKVQIAQVAHIRQEALNRLHGAQSQKKIADQGQQMLAHKRDGLAKKIAKLNAEIAAMEKDDEDRKTRVSMRKVDLE